MVGDHGAAQLCAGRLAGIFEENAALALELHVPEDERIATEVAARRRLGLPVVAVQPVYCLASSDAPKLRLLAAIRANARLGNPVADESDSEEAELENTGEGGTTLHRGSSLAGRRTARTDVDPLGVTPPPVILSGLTNSLPQTTDISEESLRWLSPVEVAARFVRFPQAVTQAGEDRGALRPLPPRRPPHPGPH